MSAAYTSSEVQARSADGTMVPLSLVYRKGLKRDGSHPVDLEGYGAYGITEDPGFSTTRIAWMERGGITPYCHSRGGGWYGDAWHPAGMIATKNHTWEDFVACGQWLDRSQYTSKAHLAAKARAPAAFRSAARSRRGRTCLLQPSTSSASATLCVGVLA